MVLQIIILLYFCLNCFAVGGYWEYEKAKPFSWWIVFWTVLYGLFFTVVLFTYYVLKALYDFLNYATKLVQKWKR